MHAKRAVICLHEAHLMFFWDFLFTKASEGIWFFWIQVFLAFACMIWKCGVCIVMCMEKNRGRGCVCGNGRDVAENGYNGEITRIAADAA
jgi:hypothetical protein